MFRLGKSLGKPGLLEADPVRQAPNHDAPGLAHLGKPGDLGLGWKLGRDILTLFSPGSRPSALCSLTGFPLSVDGVPSFLQP